MIGAIILFILILSFLIFIHELGHFYFARKFGVFVEEFGIGVPPRAWGKKVGETIYSINWLPLGGFVKIKGEDFTPDYDKNDQTNFINKKPWQRIVILMAGVFMNATLGILIFYFTLGMSGWKSTPLMRLSDYQFPFGTIEEVPNVITYIGADSPASNAGMEFADQITALQYNDETAIVQNVDDIKEFVADKEGDVVIITTYNINTGEESSYEVIPEYSEAIEQPALGISLSEAFMLTYLEPGQKAFAGPMHAYNIIGYSMSIFKDLIVQSFETKDVGPVAEGVAGPVGIFGAVKIVLDSGANRVWLVILDLVALLSLSLAIMNMLPIPALDGGRVVFVLAEWITGKKPSPKLEARAHQIGYISLLALLLLVTLKDIINLKNYF